jgi:uncharacterized protein
MANVQVHLATGPESPTRAALAMLVARTAAAEGHEVSVFLAGDAVQLLRPETAAATQGIGTGSFEEHWAALRESGASLYASGMSSKARGVDPAAAGAEAAQPQRLVELATAADTTLTY